ncbi:hypothetical protein SCLCIDRAFT_1209213 [Scleroderma citrinum Foug A]|uniref:Secreted protein n=1 Tax=Scleroderma citrinum Foug A TaxID=1036808 RepID=A0A0C3EJG3_9AGAM|nr:hypothetical protein SCLCIDRAFT_1209213 [Scleroderma citrinum Foug A]
MQKCQGISSWLLSLASTLCPLSLNAGCKTTLIRLKWMRSTYSNLNHFEMVPSTSNKTTCLDMMLDLVVVAAGWDRARARELGGRCC